MKPQCRAGVALALGITAMAGVGRGAKAPADSWRFAMLCDSRGDARGGSVNGVRTAILGPLAQQIATEGVDLVLFPGDEICGYPEYGDIPTQLKQWKATMAPILDKGIPIYLSRGNHEVIENEQTPTPGSAIELANYAAWKTVFPYLPQNGPASQLDATYYVDHRNARFVVFDQYLGRRPGYDPTRYDSSVNGGTVDPWVIAEIAGAPQTWVFAAAHETMFMIHHTDCMANDPLGRDQLLDALGERGGGGVYFCGHDHGYWRATAPAANGALVYQLLVGCAGAPFYAADHVGLNSKVDRGAVPQIEFANGLVAPGAVANTGGLGPMWGYLLVTVDGRTATGKWKALTNADPKTYSVNGPPVFKTFDTFVLRSTR